ncbi:MAG TPA: hypothetical protein VIK63_00025 [Haloplasmataceae bacterium]
MVGREMIKEWGLPEVADLQYHTILSALTRKQMMIICDFHQIANRSHLKKGDIQTILHSDIYLYLEKYMLAMYDQQLRLLYYLLVDDFLSIDDHPWHHLYFFFRLGIAYPVSYQEKNGFFIPKEIKGWIIKRLSPDLMEVFDRNNRVVAFAYEVLAAYGLMTYQSFVYFYQMKYPEDDIFHEVDLILKLESLFNQQFISEYEYFYNPSLVNHLEAFLNVFHRHFRLDYHVYHFTDKEKERLYQDESVWLKLQRALRGLSADQMDNVLRWSLGQLHLGQGLKQLQSALPNQFSTIPNRTLKRFYRTLVKVYPYLRLWIFKGNRLMDLNLK